jgi:hypothetical protein
VITSLKLRLVEMQPRQLVDNVPVKLDSPLSFKLLLLKEPPFDPLRRCSLNDSVFVMSGSLRSKKLRVLKPLGALRKYRLNARLNDRLKENELPPFDQPSVVES